MSYSLQIYAEDLQHFKRFVASDSFVARGEDKIRP
jgi:hypothetical protein